MQWSLTWKDQECLIKFTEQKDIQGTTDHTSSYTKFCLSTCVALKINES